MNKPASLVRDISPPPTRKASKNDRQLKEPTLAAVEAGHSEVRNHLEYFSKHLQNLSRPSTGPRLSIDDFQSLYTRNLHPKGRHFVIHQHDHPVSGVHYDLRLQFSESSAMSFAIPYGPPGNPNSIRPNRMAIETRVHNLWNNLIESASHATGSLLIWDTGEYEILSREEKEPETTDDDSSDDEQRIKNTTESDSERLFAAFQSRRIRLRLHGTKLPTNYTIGLWLPSKNNRTGPPPKPKTKRRRVDPTQAAAKSKTKAPQTDSDTSDNEESVTIDENADDDAGIASDEDEDATIRANNAYPGATNSIGSVHQRHWFLSLDRRRSGLHKARTGEDQGRWVGWEPFFVRGRDVERSVVTGRSADDAMADEGIEKFVGRKLWRPILE